MNVNVNCLVLKLYSSLSYTDIQCIGQLRKELYYIRKYIITFFNEWHEWNLIKWMKGRIWFSQKSQKMILEMILEVNVRIIWMSFKMFRISLCTHLTHSCTYLCQCYLITSHGLTHVSVIKHYRPHFCNYYLLTSHIVTHIPVTSICWHHTLSHTLLLILSVDVIHCHTYLCQCYLLSSFPQWLVLLTTPPVVLL